VRPLPWAACQLLLGHVWTAVELQVLRSGEPLQAEVGEPRLPPQQHGDALLIQVRLELRRDFGRTVRALRENPAHPHSRLHESQGSQEVLTDRTHQLSSRGQDHAKDRCTHIWSGWASTSPGSKASHLAAMPLLLAAQLFGIRNHPGLQTKQPELFCG
jgi:hypothetical protein